MKKGQKQALEVVGWLGSSGYQTVLHTAAPATEKAITKNETKRRVEAKLREPMAAKKKD